MAFKIKNLKGFKKKLKLIGKAGDEMQKDLSKEIPIDYIFTLGKNTPLAQARDFKTGKKIKGRGLAKSAWFQMLPRFGKRTNLNRTLPPESSTVTTIKTKNRQTSILTNAIQYIGYLDMGGRHTPPHNILAKSKIEMDAKTKKRLDKSALVFTKLWKRGGLGR